MVKITHNRSTGFDTWITSDGRVYVCQLIEAGYLHSTTDEEQENQVFEVLAVIAMRVCAYSILQDSASSATPTYAHWQGTCIHDLEVPKWVQKQRQRDPSDSSSEPAYNDPRQAMIIAVNTKFSMFAAGTYRQVDDKSYMRKYHRLSDCCSVVLLSISTFRPRKDTSLSHEYYKFPACIPQKGRELFVA